MEPKNKHNIFSKEELFKLIDEKKSLPPEADDFDKEALEGLALVSDRKKLDALDEAIDEALKREAAKASRKRNMYYFAAAASLLLVIGFFFLLKENTLLKEDAGLAINNAAKVEEAPPVLGKDLAESSEEKTIAPAADAQVATGEAKAKETLKTGKLQDVETAKGETFAAEVKAPVPAEEAENDITLSLNEKAVDNVAGAGADRLDTKLEDKKLGGKAAQGDLSSFGKEELQKREQSKKVDEKKVLKWKEEKDVKEEKEKIRYETNTVWTTPSSGNKTVVDELKQNTQTETKPGTTDDNRNQPVTSTTSAAPVQTQEGMVLTGSLDEDKSKADKAPMKNAEVISSVQKSKKGPSTKKYRSKNSRSSRVKSAFGDGGGEVAQQKKPKDEPAQPTERAGYAYYAQTSTRDFRSPEFTGGDEALQKFVKENLKISAPDKKGTVVVEFLVKTDGSIDVDGIKVSSPIKNCDVCSKDVIDLVKKMPKWQPATENGDGKVYRQKLSVQYDAKMAK